MLVAVLAASGSSGCGSSSSAGEDAYAPPVLTVVAHSRGIVMSTPAGIQCGQCSGSGPVCPLQPPPVYTDCSHEFPAGTSVQLTLEQQDIYFAAACSYTGGGAQIPSCTLTITGPAIVDVTGIEAVR